MERLRSFLCFKTAPSFVFPTTTIFTKLPSRFWNKAKAAKSKGLVSLSKDKELCEGYADIETMWRMIHSTCSKENHSSGNCKGPRYLVFCFKPS